MCETRWYTKYKSTSLNIFSTLLTLLVLETLDFIGNNNTHIKAHQLSCAISTLQFVISLNIISKHSAQLELVTNK